MAVYVDPSPRKRHMIDTRLAPKDEHVVMARQLGLAEHRPLPPRPAPTDARMKPVDVRRLAEETRKRKLI